MACWLAETGKTRGRGENQRRRLPNMRPRQREQSFLLPSFSPSSVSFLASPFPVLGNRVAPLAAEASHRWPL